MSRNIHIQSFLSVLLCVVLLLGCAKEMIIERVEVNDRPKATVVFTSEVEGVEIKGAIYSFYACKRENSRYGHLTVPTKEGLAEMSIDVRANKRLLMLAESTHMGLSQITLWKYFSFVPEDDSKYRIYISQHGHKLNPEWKVHVQKQDAGTGTWNDDKTASHARFVPFKKIIEGWPECE